MKLERDQIQNSLQAMQKVFAGIDDYRVLGSLLVAAINGSPHRELHDIDLLIDERVFDRIASNFNQQGFKRTVKHAPGFEWDEFSKPDHLKFGVLLKGRFDNSYFVYKANRWLRLQIKNDYLTPTEYRLFDQPIRGIPLRSVHEGIKAASLNTKRKADREVVKQAIKGKLPDGQSLAQAFQVKVLGINVPYLYNVFSQIYNVVGGIRLRFGKSYDPWA